MEGIIRHLFFFIDKIVYGFIPTVYDFIVTLANQNIFQEEVITKIAGRIYAILGVYVLFRLAFILLLAIVDPNKLMDKEKGFGKILTRFIIGLFMIVAIPWVFDYAYKFQGVILKNNIITTVVFGEQADEGTSGGILSQATFSAFFTCSDPNDDGTKCGGLSNAIETAFGPSKDWSLLDSALTEKKDGKFVYEYSAGVSTVAGIAILLLLITFSFDVAVRIVKLGFLEMITPLAVIGYIEPGGKGFASWQKTAVSTYINLFVRLLAITFAGYIISLLNPLSPAIDIKADNPASIPLIRVFIIIGTLIFAKEAPKIITDMFGVKDTGMGGFNPFKKINSVVGAGIIGGAVGAGAKLVGGGVGGIAGGIYAKKAGGSAFAGTFQGMKTGFGSVKMKDAAKGNITGIGKTLGKGTFGAIGAAGSYVNKQVTGKDKKVGLANAAKQQMAKYTNSLHQGAASNADQERWDKLKAKMASGGSLYSPEYQTALDNVKRAKDESINRENTKNKWRVLYENNPEGTYKGTDGNVYKYKDAYELANKNSLSAQKNLDFVKSELDTMGKTDKFKEDAELKSFVERMESMDKNQQLNAEFGGTYSGAKPILKNVPDEDPTSRPRSNPGSGPGSPIS